MRFAFRLATSSRPRARPLRCPGGGALARAAVARFPRRPPRWRRRRGCVGVYARLIRARRCRRDRAAAWPSPGCCAQPAVPSVVVKLALAPKLRCPPLALRRRDSIILQAQSFDGERHARSVVSSLLHPSSSLVDPPARSLSCRGLAVAARRLAQLRPSLSPLPSCCVWCAASEYSRVPSSAAAGATTSSGAALALPQRLETHTRPPPVDRLPDSSGAIGEAADSAGAAGKAVESSDGGKGSGGAWRSRVARVHLQHPARDHQDRDLVSR